MSAKTDLDNYWIRQHSDPQTLPEPYLKLETIEGVEPLNAQFGIDEPKNVPDALYVPLFGHPEGAEDNVQQAGSNPTNLQPLNTYAILDAAKVPGLPELLAASRLEHRCLFQGDAYDELKDVAPWIVHLEESNSLTRHLFTRSKAAWHLWDEEPGIFLRSCDSLEEVWKHFRKFTKIETSQNEVVFFRFWDGVTWDALSRTQEKDMDFIAALLSHHVVIYRSSVRLDSNTFAVMGRVAEVLS